LINKIRSVVENSFVIWTGILFLLILVFTGKASTVVGNYFPVVTPLKIDSIEEIFDKGLPSVIISGTSTKLRNCDQRTMNWFIREGRNEGSVFSMFMDEPKSREIGVIEFKGIVVGLPKNKIEFSRSEVVHDCFGGQVRVVTQFFTGSKAFKK